MGSKSPQRKITDADREAARRLKRIWSEKKKKLNIASQEQAAEKLGFGTQGAVSHYLNCRVALGPVATMKFARLLEVTPQDIRPDFEYSLLPSEIPQDIAELAIELAGLDEETRKDAVRFLRLTLHEGYIDFVERMRKSNEKTKTATTT